MAETVQSTVHIRQEEDCGQTVVRLKKGGGGDIIMPV